MGLTIGMSACFLVFLYVKFELSYDNFHSKSDRIYRVVTDINNPSETLTLTVAAPAMPVAAKRDFPEIEKQVRFGPGNILVRRGDVKTQEENMAFADSTFFEIFDFPLLRGNPVTALRGPWTIVLSETAAKKYFGTEDPMGQHLLLTGDSHPATVTGIMKDMPENTELKADMLVSMYNAAGDSSRDQNWGGFGVFSYFLLKPHTNARALQNKFPAFLVNHIGKFMKDNNQTYTYLLEPLKDVYLRSRGGKTAEGNLTNVYVFGIVGLFIILIAGINFVNLTTARSTERAREVGIRKVVGAERGQLTGQFLGESVILCLLAFVLSVGVCAALIPSFNFLAGKTISTGIFHHPGYILALLLIGLGIGLLAGIYPALVLFGLPAYHRVEGTVCHRRARAVAEKRLGDPAVYDLDRTDRRHFAGCRSIGLYAGAGTWVQQGTGAGAGHAWGRPQDGVEGGDQNVARRGFRGNVVQYARKRGDECVFDHPEPKGRDAGVQS